MEARYPTDKDWDEFLASPNSWEGTAGIAFLGTIADVLQRAELCKKGAGAFDLATFVQRFEALRQGPLCTGGILHILALDPESFVDAAFDVDLAQGEAGVRLWREIANKDIRPWRTLRRLVLRPLEHRWWGEEPYQQMEEYFGEEAGRHG